MEAAEVAVTSGGDDILAFVDFHFEIAHDFLKEGFCFVKFKVVEGIFEFEVIFQRGQRKFCNADTFFFNIGFGKFARFIKEFAHLGNEPASIPALDCRNVMAV